MDDIGTGYAVILGGDSAVTPAVEDDLVAKLGEVDVDRIEGSNRYRTAARLAAWGVGWAGMTWNGLGVSTGESFPDALTGGVVQGRTRSVMLLTKPTSVPAGTSEKLTEITGRVGAVRFFGGTSAVSTPVRTQILGILE